MLDTYRVTLEGNETVDGHDCYRLKLEAKTRDAVYQLERVWVDKQLFAYRKVVLYSLSGKPVKEMHITDFKKIGGKNIPVLMEMRDLMKKNSKTVFTTESMSIDVPLDPYLFSLEELSW